MGAAQTRGDGAGFPVLDGPHVGSPGTVSPEGTARVRIGEVMRYLGHGGQEVDATLMGRIEAAAARADAELAPRWVWQAFAVEQDGGADGTPAMRVGGTALVLGGRSMADHLRDARGVVLMACTLGAACDRRLRELSATDPLGQVAFDAACSDLVEWACDACESEVVAWAHERGLHAGSRYSPGYGDLPLAVQPRFLDVLNAGRLLGLTASASYLLVPTKSVTAVIGLFAGPAPAAKKGCAHCNLRAHCQLRARGTACYRG